MPSRARPKPSLGRHYLKEWREFRQLSQEQAATRLDLSRTQLSKIENMKSPYSQGILEAAAYAYRCTEADLLMRNPLNAEAPWSLQDSLLKAPKPLQNQIRAIVETLLKTAS